MFRHLTTHWYKGGIDTYFSPGTRNVLFCRLFPKFIICDNPPKVTSDEVLCKRQKYIDSSRKIGRFQMSTFKQMQGQNANCQFITPYYICVTADKSVITLPRFLGIILVG